MRAITFRRSLRFRKDLPEPRPRRDEARIRVRLAGICNTDLEIARGYMGFGGTLGHEFVGEVERGPGGLVGRRVVGEINCGCGRCAECRSGDPRHCPGRSVLGILGRDGAMADVVTLPARNLHVVPDEVPDESAVFAEPLAAAFEILEQVPVEPGLEAVVLGDGKLGLLVAQVLAQAGARVTAVGRHDEKLRLLRRRGIRLRRSGARGRLEADLVAECTGTARGLEEALAIVRPRGTVILKSTVAEKEALDLAPVVIDEVRIVGSRCGPFRPALDALARESVDVAGMVSEVYPIEKGVEAFDHAATAGTLKVLIRPG